MFEVVTNEVSFATAFVFVETFDALPVLMSIGADQLGCVDLALFVVPIVEVVPCVLRDVLQSEGSLRPLFELRGVALDQPARSTVQTDGLAGVPAYHILMVSPG